MHVETYWHGQSQMSSCQICNCENFLFSGLCNLSVWSFDLWLKFCVKTICWQKLRKHARHISAIQFIDGCWWPQGPLGPTVRLSQLDPFFWACWNRQQLYIDTGKRQNQKNLPRQDQNTVQDRSTSLICFNHGKTHCPAKTHGKILWIIEFCASRFRFHVYAVLGVWNNFKL